MDTEAPVEIEAVLGPYRVGVATTYGPRLTSLRHDNVGDLFARLPDSTVLTGPHGTFRFHGGHRLWAGPETPAVTHAPDEHPCEVSLSPNGLTVTAPADAVGLVKQISVAAEEAELLVDHKLTNTGPARLSIAPWAITQLAMGGTALLSLDRGDVNGLQPDRRLVLWPYSRLNDHRLTWLGDCVAISAVDGPRLKLGAGPRPGRLGYFKDGFLLTKEIDRPDEPLPDHGAVLQVFVGDGFCELESVGSLTEVDPQGSVSHRERWRLLACSDLSAAIAEVDQ